MVLFNYNNDLYHKAVIPCGAFLPFSCSKSLSGVGQMTRYKIVMTRYKIVTALVAPSSSQFLLRQYVQTKEHCLFLLSNED